MGNLWLPDMDDWIRDIGGLRTDTWKGWLSRSRASGGYDDIFGIECHHDASAPSTSLISAASYGLERQANAPVGAIWLDRGTSGRVMVGAAGATNTSGLGGPLQCSRGTIPRDSANRYVISIEALNNGVGEFWQPQNRDAYVRVVAALIIGLREKGAYDARNGIYRKIFLNPLVKGDVHAHFEWAPTRKIDPAGPPDPFADMSDRYKRWKMNDFRRAVDAMVRQLSGSMPPPPIPPPPPPPPTPPPIPSPTPPPGAAMTQQFTRWYAYNNGERMYDSRPNTPAYHNPTVPKVRLKPGEIRKIAVAMAHVAEIRVTAVNADAPGYIIASGAPGQGLLPIVNFVPGGAGYDTRTIGIPDGHVYLWLPETSKFGPVDFIVDLFGYGILEA